MKKLTGIILVVFMVMIGANLYADADDGQQLAVFKNLTVKQGENVLETLLEIDGEFNYQHFELIGPTRLVVEFSRVDKIIPPEMTEVDKMGIKRIRVGQYKPYTVRTVFDFENGIPAYEVNQVANGIAVIFRAGEPMEETAPAVAAEPARSPESVQATALNHIRCNRTDGQIHVGVACTGDVQAKQIEFIKSTPSILVLEFSPVQNLSAQSMTQTDFVELQRVSVERPNPNAARLTLLFGKQVDTFKLNRVPTGWDIVFKATEEKAPVTRPGEKPVPARKPQVLQPAIENMIVAVTWADYAVPEQIFNQIYGASGSMFGIELSRVLFNSGNHNLMMSLEGRTYSKTGASTITGEETTFNIMPISLAGKYVLNTRYFNPYFGFGLDLYNYKETSDVHTAEGSVLGAHYQLGAYVKIPNAEFLKLKFYAKFTKALVKEQDVEDLNIGGMEIGVGLAFGFNLGGTLGF